MKMWNVNRVIFLLLVVLATLTAQVVSAANEQPVYGALNNLHQIRLLNTKAITDFYMFIGLNADTRYSRQIEESKTKTERLVEELVAFQDIPEFNAQTASVSKQWKKVSNLLTTNIRDVKTQGYSDNRLVSDLLNEGLVLNELINNTYTNLQTLTDKKVNQWTDKSRAQSLLMRYIALQYSARSAAFTGGFAMYDKPLDELVVEFKTAFSSIADLNINTPEIQKELNSVDTKWRFIEKSLINYNDDSVPYVVSVYADKIVNSLENAATLYEKVGS